VSPTSRARPARCCASADRQAAVVGRAGDELVLARRRGRAVADAAAGQERARRHRRGRHRLPGDLLDRRSRSARLAAWLAPDASSCCRRWSAPSCSALFALDLGWATYGAPLRSASSALRKYFVRARHPHRHRSRRLAIAGGLFIVPAFAAVQAWAGADRARASSPPSTCSTPLFMVGGTAHRRGCCRRLVRPPQLFLLIGVLPPHRRRRHRPAPCRRSALRDFLSIISAPCTASR
jgi:hypothetical protein